MPKCEEDVYFIYECTTLTKNEKRDQQTHYDFVRVCVFLFILHNNSNEHHLYSSFDQFIYETRTTKIYIDISSIFNNKNYLVAKKRTQIIIIASIEFASSP